MITAELFLLFDKNYRLLFDGHRAIWLPQSTVEALGVDPATAVRVSTGHSALRVPTEMLKAALGLNEGARLVTPREIPHAGGTQDILRAASMLRHSENYRFDPRDGSPLTYSNDGAIAQGASGREIYPRIDPAVIGTVELTTVNPAQRRLLLARNAQRSDYFSLIAGYISPGETPEECFEREVLEETGRRVRDVRYVASQPWPMSGSLMLGFEALTEDEEAIQETDGELAEICWFSADELTSGKIPLPGPGSIAYRMIDNWMKKGQ